jgi:hypothetical protein
MTKATPAAGVATGKCLCGKVVFEIDTPARWAWHDHSAASRRAHGAAYATYVGSWRKRFRVTKGNAGITRFEDKATQAVRSFCAQCGTPLIYERARSPHMVNLPRALFSGRTGRQPLYHIAIEQLQEWTWTGEPLVPLKGFPGVVALEKEEARRARGDVLKRAVVGAISRAAGSRSSAENSSGCRSRRRPRPVRAPPRRHRGRRS